MAEVICALKLSCSFPAAMQQRMLTPEEQMYWFAQMQQAQLAAAQAAQAAQVAAGYNPQMYGEPYAQQAQHFMFEQPAGQSYATVPRLQLKCRA